MKTFFATLLITTSLVSCTNSGSGPSDRNQQNASKPATDPEDITDRSRCIGEKLTGLDIYSFPWEVENRSSSRAGVFLSKKMIITTDRIDITVRAEYRSPGQFQSQEIIVSSPAEVTENQVKILERDYNLGALRIDGEPFYFEITLTPSQFEYSFQGICLKIDPKSSPPLLMVPGESQQF